jgi:hypothetical protein
MEWNMELCSSSLSYGRMDLELGIAMDSTPVDWMISLLLINFYGTI